MTKTLWNLISKGMFFSYVFLFVFEISKRTFLQKKNNSSKCGAMLL